MSAFTHFRYNQVNNYLGTIQPAVESALFKGKVVVIYGARQVGQTTLCRAILRRFLENYELDHVEEEGGRLVGFECKWRDKRRQPPGVFIHTYPDSEAYLVTRENYLEFLT